MEIRLILAWETCDYKNLTWVTPETTGNSRKPLNHALDRVDIIMGCVKIKKG